MIVGFYNGFNKHKSGSKSELWFDFLMENHKAFASLLYQKTSWKNALHGSEEADMQ